MSILDESPPPEDVGPGPKAAILAGSLLVTGVLVSAALFLGSWAFGQREGSLHVGRLEALVQKHPRGEDVRAGLEAEGTRLLGSADGAEALAPLVARLAPGSDAAVRSRAGGAARTRVFRASRYLYWLFFDARDTLTGFVVTPAGADAP